MTEKIKSNNLIATGHHLDDIKKHIITKKGLRIIIRAVRINDERAMSKFFRSLSSESIDKRFLSRNRYLPNKRIQDFVVFNCRENMFLIATIKKYFRETILGLVQYWLDKDTRMADVAFVVLDKYHRQGICEELLKYQILLAKNRIINGFKAEVLVENIPMLNLFEKYGFKITNRINGNIYELKLNF